MIRILTYNRSHSVKNLGYSTSTWLDGRVEDYQRDVIIRWGNNCLINGREFPNVLNPARAITLNMSKILAHDALSEVVNTPRMYRKYTPNFGTFVVRPCAHEGGSGFRVVEANGRAINLSQGCEYATEYIRTNCEYRVWFCGRRTLRAQRARTPEQQRVAIPRFICRSKWGYNFLDEVPTALHNQTLQAAKAIGLDCGAADVLLSNGRWYFLELNSGCSTDLGYLQRWFKEGINRLVNERF